MAPKEYLSRYKKIEKELFALEDEQRAIRNRLYGLQACSYDDSPKILKTPKQAKFEPLLDKLMAVEENITKKIDAMVDTRNEISNVIESVDDEILRALLRYRYLCGFTFEQIAVKMGYSYYHTTHFLHPKALKNIHLNTP